MTPLHAAFLFHVKDKVSIGDAWLGSSEKQEQGFIGKKLPVSTSNSHLEGKLKLQGRGNDGPNTIWAGK